MAFPTNTTVIDDFNRTNGAIGANWTSNPFGFGSDAAIIESNAIRSPAGGTDWCEGYWNPATFGPDFEFYIHITTKPGNNEIIGVHYVHPTGIGGSGVDGFSSYLQTLSGTDTLSLQRITNQSWTDLGASPVSQEFTAGWWLGIERIGATISGWYFNGSIWVQYATATDANHTGAGRLAFDIQGTTGRINEVRGGTVVVATPELEQSAYRHRNDDGSESSATNAADLNTPITLARQSPIRTRIQLNATADLAAMQFQEEYRRKRTGVPADPWKVM